MRGTVSDGFDFRPPPERREARRFEPPPWEREQFERMARERAETEQAELDAALAAAEIAVASEEQVAPVTGEGLAGAEGLGSEQAARHSSALAGPVHAGEPAVAPLDEKRVAMMMLELRAEEPQALSGAWAVNLGAGVTVGLIGAVITIWGSMAIGNRDLGPMGALGGGVMIVFGVAFVGIGGWLIFRALRQRGVL
jgi:hypothetical protein